MPSTGDAVTTSVSVLMLMLMGMLIVLETMVVAVMVRTVELMSNNGRLVTVAETAVIDALRLLRAALKTEMAGSTLSEVTEVAVVTVVTVLLVISEDAADKSEKAMLKTDSMGEMVTVDVNVVIVLTV